MWNFPAGIPHSIQGFEEGCEFLLIFDDGNFSEDSTFLITDWFNCTPRDVLAKILASRKGISLNYQQMLIIRAIYSKAKYRVRYHLIRFLTHVERDRLAITYPTLNQ
jgi:hypothetical protein